MRATILAGCAALALAGCQMDPFADFGPPMQAESLLPNAVLQALPSGVLPSDVVVRERPAPGGFCYFYADAGGKLHPVPADPAAPDYPVCVM